MLNTKPFTLTTLLGLGLLTAAISFSGCSSTESTTSKAKTGSGQTLSPENYSTALNDCLREHGINVEDGRNGSVKIEMNDEFNDLFKSASQDCEKKLGKRPVDENSPSNAEQQKINQEIVECLRNKGYNVPDVREGEQISVPEDLNENDAQFCFSGGKSIGKSESIEL